MRAARSPDTVLVALLKDEDTASHGFVVAGCCVENLPTDHLAWSLPAHRRGTLGGMDAAKELPWTCLQRVPRRWAGKGPAATAKTCSSRALQLIHRFRPTISKHSRCADAMTWPPQSPAKRLTAAPTDYFDAYTASGIMCA
ncbi:hypothetical protein DZD52_03210 [Xanthomonas nasturtii]|uniref:Uncharacterized protein n=1 Tax=Xanthomonas nasturtii TaxID=1843581 RepID=A0A3E1KQW0_9XANT|nr:hypothetical protein DZD52_03210 [Xanthomonas nasturtii]